MQIGNRNYTKFYLDLKLYLTDGRKVNIQLSTPQNNRVHRILYSGIQRKDSEFPWADLCA